MADPQKIQQLVSEAVSSRLGMLERSLVQEISESFSELIETAEKRANEAEHRAADAERRADKAEKAAAEAASKPSYPPGGAPTDLLGAAVATIADAGSQADILRATLDGIAQFAARTTLYVVKGGQLTGWQSRGFNNDGAIKGASLNPGTGLAARAMNDKEPVSAAAAEFDKAFVSTHGNPVDGNATVLPLVVREKVSALIYVDAGTVAPGNADMSAVRVLVRTASMLLEILALRKIASGSAEAEAPAAEPPAPVAQAAAAAASSPALTPTPVPEASASASAAPSTGGPDVSGLPEADQEAHKKAKRFAKLLVDEIKLYNQKKVEEGKKNRDLYNRLKEDIEKSRQTYEKRWGTSAAGPANYFQAELVRILADGDESLLGA
jgi:hypothetical protein